MDIREFLTDPAGKDWKKLLGYWTPPLEPHSTLWFVNRLGEPFVVAPGGAVQWLVVGTGELVDAAASREAFARQIDVPENAEKWLRIPLVRACVAGGVALGADECLGFRIPPALMGGYEASNLVPTNIYSHYSWLSHTARQDEIYWMGD
jgi:hypothetical protein